MKTGCRFSAVRFLPFLALLGLSLVIFTSPGRAQTETSVAPSRTELAFPSVSADGRRPRAESNPWLSRRIFNIDFGPWIPKEEKSGQEGPAAAGFEKDFWNVVGIPWSNHHRVTRMKYASGDSSTIQVELKNLGGAWNSRGRMGVKSAMLDCYHYPMNNQGGNAEVILHHVYPGRYALYLYGHGAYANYYGDYTVTVGEREYGRKQTAATIDAVRAREWEEGLQYVKFPRIEVGEEETVRIVIQPGGEIVDPHGRRIRDAMICGLQLIPQE